MSEQWWHVKLSSKWPKSIEVSHETEHMVAIKQQNNKRYKTKCATHSHYFPTLKAAVQYMVETAKQRIETKNLMIGRMEGQLSDMKIELTILINKARHNNILK